MAGSTQNWKPAAIRYLLFGGLVAGCLLTIFILAADTAKKLETLRLEASDNISWTLAQMDVESLALQISVLRAKANANIAELGELRLRYDILYSRVQTIKNSPLFDALHNSPAMQQLVEEISSSLNQILPIIDGDNAGLRSSLNQLDMIALGIREQARELSLAAVSVYAERSDDNREAIAYTLLLLALFTSLLIFVLLILVTILYRLYEEVRKSAARQAVATSRLEGIIRASPSGIILADSTGRILEFNESAQKIFGYTRKEVLGATASRLLLEPEVGKFHDDRIADFLSGGDETYVNAGSRDTFALRKNGQIFPATIATAASWTETKPHFVIFVRDITDRKRVEAEILTARDRAQAGERAKSYLLAMVSHEIRTPLNGIIGILSLLASTSLNQRQKEYVKMMRDSGKLLRAHVDDLLDISSIETGQVQILARPVDLRELLSDTADSQRTLVSSNKNELTVNVIQQEKSQLMLDAGRVHQTLVNLINNATKFTKNGKIIVEAEVEKNHDGTTVEFRVIDNGVGIEEADQVRIFQDFITLDPSYSRHYEGTGLGLGIVRRLVEAMDGEYGVESEPGAGSVFWFRLPVQTAQEPSAEIADDNPDPNVEIEKKSILIVEDNLINREVLRDMLQLDGHDVTITVDGQAGVDAAQSRRFDLIFMDISMPGLDGVQATQILRSSEGPCRDTPIIALTAHAMPDEIIRFREAGMNHCATKPIELSELRKLVSGGFRKAAFKSSPNERSENSEDALFALLDTLGEEKFKAVTAEFLEQGEHVLDFLAGAMTDDSIAEMQTLVHQMLGSLSFLGLNGLIAVLSELDFASKNNEITRIMGFGREFSEGWQDARKWLVEKAALKGVDLG